MQTMTWILLLTVISAVCSVAHSQQHETRSWYPHGQRDETRTRPYIQHDGQAFTLQMETCNGFINQRLSILYGLVLATRSRRAMLLPKLRLNGRQFVDEVGGTDGVVPFSHFYDVDHFVATMAPHVALLTDLNVNGSSTFIKATELRSLTDTMVDVHVHVACPLFHLDRDIVLQHKPLVQAWLHAFEPAPRFHAMLQDATARMEHGRYNFIHWRAEHDWVRHCQRWRKGRPDDNCDTNTDDVAKFLTDHRVETSLPLYMAMEAAKVDEGRLTRVLKSLEQLGFSIVTQHEVFGLPSLQELEREERALLDYELALRANKFVGNSVSTFSALLLWERPGWSTYYNLGDIPMNHFLPFFKPAYP